MQWRKQWAKEILSIVGSGPDLKMLNHVLAPFVSKYVS